MCTISYTSNQISMPFVRQDDELCTKANVLAFNTKSSARPNKTFL